MSVPKVSICLPVVNGIEFLPERMDTIFGQRFSDWELIIADSFSDDGTWEYLQQYRSDGRVHFHQIPKEGIYPAWNFCLEQARGDYVYIATADDTASPDMLEKMVALLDRHSDASIACCDFDLIDAAGDVLARRGGFGGHFYGEALKMAHRRPGALEFLVHSFFGPSWTTITGILFRRSLLDKVGLFRTDLGPFADNYWARRSAMYSDTLYIPEKLATWRQHGEQRSRHVSAYQDTRKMTAGVDTLKQCESGLPAEWRNIPAWRESLLQTDTNDYYEQFHLQRHHLRQDLMRFVGGLMCALRHCPLYAIKQVLRGLPTTANSTFAEECRLVDLFCDQLEPRLAIQPLQEPDIGGESL